MRKIGLLLLSLSLLATSAIAENIIDLYGSDDKTAQDVIREYGKEVGDVETIIQREVLRLNDSDESQNKINDIMTKRLDLVDKIKNKYGFIYVDFQTIIYSDRSNQFTTIEVIKRNEPERINFISPPIKKPVSKKTNTDLIDKMDEYNTIGYSLFIKNQLGKKPQKCPVFHCSWGFGHPKLKPYFSIFNEGAIHERQLILDTLNKDKNPDRRANAAFLMGHFRDPNDIIFLLSSHITDHNDGVRNNVVRVISGTMHTAKIQQIDVIPFLKLLDSPYNTNRINPFFPSSNIVITKIFAA